MNLSRKAKIFIGVGLTVTAVIFSVAGYGLYSAYSFFKEVGTFAEVGIPDALKEARVLKGADFLAKSEVYKLEKFSYSEVIARSLQIPDAKKRQEFIASHTAKGIYGFDGLKICNDEIIAVGRFGGFAFDLSGNLKREIYFEPSERTIKIGWYEQKEHKADLDNLKIIELDNQGKCGFMSNGYREGVTVYDLDGKRIWNYGEETVANLGKMLEEKDDLDNKIYVTEAATGDLDGDGLAEFIVARKNDGIRVFDRDSNEKWFQPDDFPTATMIVLDVDGDGKNELLEIGSDAKIRNSSGEIIKELKVSSSSDAFLFTEEKDKRKNLQFCKVYENKLTCSDENKKEFIQADAPLGEVEKNKTERAKATPIYIGNGEAIMPDESNTEGVYEPSAVWVKLQKDKPKYLAVIASFIGIPRSNLYVYDEKGNLIYHELLPEDAETIAAVPLANSSEEIFIGGKDTIWKFTAK